jgi:hypothetical protein
LALPSACRLEPQSLERTAGPYYVLSFNSWKRFLIPFLRGWKRS